MLKSSPVYKKSKIKDFGLMASEPAMHGLKQHAI